MATISFSNASILSVVLLPLLLLLMLRSIEGVKNRERGMMGQGYNVGTDREREEANAVQNLSARDDGPDRLKFGEDKAANATRRGEDRNIIIWRNVKCE